MYFFVELNDGLMEFVMFVNVLCLCSFFILLEKKIIFDINGGGGLFFIVLIVIGIEYV